MSGGHTPGPWAVNPVNAWVELPGRDAPIAAMCWPTELRTEDETFSNARLVSAAPDLLKVCQRMLDFSRSGANFYYPLGSLQELRLAVAKATGK